MSKFPENLKYSHEHEWVLFENSLATVGITSFACEQLGDVVYVELPKIGESIKAGQPIGAVESTKAASDIFCPVSGKIVEVNSSLADKPEHLGEDPYGKGWLLKVEISEPQELQSLLTAEQYQQHAQTSGH
jgi:glycine cleavage system H protein